MKVLGVVVEYNPFHNGHLYHLEKAKELIGADFTVAVMSGNFTQRGEPAIIDKFSRAEIALRHGVDVVVELPFVYATQDAGGFAFGAVGVLHKLGLVTDIVFGSESADEEFLIKVAKVLHEQPWRYQEILHVKLKKGLSFPNARKEALVEYFREEGTLNPERVKNIERSNDILGVEYVRAILRYGSDIRFHAIKRVGASYTDEHFRGKFSSATSIRKLVRERAMELVKEAVPEESFRIIEREIREGRAPVFWEDMERVFLARFRLMNREDFEEIYGFTEGLDKRFWDSAKRAGTLREFVEAVKAKRFTFSRIRRLMLYALFGIKPGMMDKANKLGPQYIRVLGFTEKGRKFLSKAKRVAKVPIITTPSLYKKALEELDEERHEVDDSLFLWMFDMDIKATMVHTLLIPDPGQRDGERDFKKRVIVL